MSKAQQLVNAELQARRFGNLPYADELHQLLTHLLFPLHTFVNVVINGLEPEKNYYQIAPHGDHHPLILPTE